MEAGRIETMLLETLIAESVLYQPDLEGLVLDTKEGQKLAILAGPIEIVDQGTTAAEITPKQIIKRQAAPWNPGSGTYNPHSAALDHIRTHRWEILRPRDKDCRFKHAASMLETLINMIKETNTRFHCTTITTATRGRVWIWFKDGHEIMVKKCPKIPGPGHPEHDNIQMDAYMVPKLNVGYYATKGMSRMIDDPVARRPPQCEGICQGGQQIISETHRITRAASLKSDKEYKKIRKSHERIEEAINVCYQAINNIGTVVVNNERSRRSNIGTPVTRSQTKPMRSWVPRKTPRPKERKSVEINTERTGSDGTTEEGTAENKQSQLDQQIIEEDSESEFDGETFTCQKCLAVFSNETLVEYHTCENPENTMPGPSKRKKLKTPSRAKRPSTQEEEDENGE